jgi:hypothetical protein
MKGAHHKCSLRRYLWTLWNVKVYCVLMSLSGTVQTHISHASVLHCYLPVSFVFRHISQFSSSCCSLPSEFTTAPGRTPHRRPQWSLVSEPWQKWVSTWCPAWPGRLSLDETGLWVMGLSVYNVVRKQVFLQTWRAVISKQFWILQSYTERMYSCF